MFLDNHGYLLDAPMRQDEIGLGSRNPLDVFSITCAIYLEKCAEVKKYSIFTMSNSEKGTKRTCQNYVMKLVFFYKFE